MAENARAKKRINLALQGGGAHGAFTWGVLDRLLQEPELEIAGICGTSAGAMNGAVLAYGLSLDGAQTGRERLSSFWESVSHRARMGPLQPSPIDKFFSIGDMEFSPGWQFYDVMSRIVSPYVSNPLNYNPLIDVLDEAVDFPWLRRNFKVQLFVCATNVKTGRIRVFGCDEITAKSVMASACLPFLFQAVEIDGQHFWDGGYMGNPPIYPLIYNTDCEDVLVVQINPINVDEVPKTASEIIDRMNDLSFNSSLMREMRAISFVKKLLSRHEVERGRYKDLKVHAIDAEREMAQLGYSSKLNADRGFLDYLFKLGRARADEFLEKHFEKINVESSIDVEAHFL